MFLRIEAQNYRCLREVSQTLNPFEILVGSNASGKSTFLDAIGFLSDLLVNGLEWAVGTRTDNFHDLVWGREGNTFRLNLQTRVPPSKRSRLFALQPQAPGEAIPDDVPADLISYNLSVKLDPTTGELFIADENSFLASSIVEQKGLPDPVLVRSGSVLELWSESTAETFRRDQHHNYSSLMALPDDRLFPAATWLREFLRYGIRTVDLNPVDLAKPSPPSGDGKRVTGASLARQVARLNNEHPTESQDWLAHIRTALPDIRKIDAVSDGDLRHRFVVIEYENGIRVPSWMLSEGTLRLLALTILAYLPDPAPGVYLIEEPENGVHPTALETIYQSLSSVPNAQVLVASHSPVLLSMARPEQILCFSKTAEGTRIVRGNEHPALQEWRGEVSLGTLAASGILG